MSYFIVLSFLPFILQAITLCVGFWKYKNEVHVVLADRWLTLVLKIVINKSTKVRKTLIENSIGDSEDKKEMRNLVEVVGQYSGMTS